MRRLIDYFRSYWAETGQPWYLLSILALSCLLVYANYACGLEAHWVRSIHGQGARILHAYLLYAPPYWLAFGLQYVFAKGVTFHRHRRWWGVLLAAPLLFAVQTTLPVYWPTYYAYAIQYVVRSACLILPPVLFWYFRDRQKQALYGMQRPDTWGYYPYLVLLMIPLLLYASVQPDFLHLYPRVKVLSAAPDRWRAAIAYEAGYGLDIFSMEFFFRGFLILGLVKVCKAQAILPAALFYCTAHFGKPMAECISSLFGGLMLGVIAYKSRSIYVGVLLHLCLAWGLEVLASVR